MARVEHHNGFDDQVLLVPLHVSLLILHEVVRTVATALLGEVAPLAADEGNNGLRVVGECQLEVEFVVLVPRIEAEAAHHVQAWEPDGEERPLQVV